jgi:hypothetical protein
MRLSIQCNMSKFCRENQLIILLGLLGGGLGSVAFHLQTADAIGNSTASGPSPNPVHEAKHLEV